MTQNIRCPECGGALQVPTQAFGKRVRCPRCLHRFVASSGGGAAKTTVTVKTTPRSPTTEAAIKATRSEPHRSRPVEEDEVDDRPRKKKKKRHRKQKSALPWIVGGGIGATVCVVGLVVLLVTRGRNGSKAQPAPAVVAELPPPPRSEPTPKNQAPKVVNPPAPDKLVQLPDPAPKPPPPAAVDPDLVIREIKSPFRIPESTEAGWLKNKEIQLQQARATMRLAYDKIGRRNAAWDESAREALELSARMFTAQPNKPSHPDIYPHVMKAINAGCNDPLILYLYGRTVPSSDEAGPDEIRKRFVQAAEALKKSSYSPFRRAMALHVAAQHLARPQLSVAERKLGMGYLKEALALLAQSMNEEADNPEIARQWRELASRIRGAYSWYSADMIAGLEFIEKGLAKAPNAAAVCLKVRGEFKIIHGWEARGNGTAQTVTEDGARKFRERLEEAETALQAAWQADLTDAWTATRMLTVLKALSGDQEDVEDWFGRAMKANPDSVEAVEGLLDYLDPKWHGSDAEVLAFGRVCRDTKNGYSRIRLAVAEAHARAIWRRPPSTIATYFHTVPVWKDVSEVYEDYFKKQPQDHDERSRFAMYCYLSGKFDLAAENFQLAKNHLGTNLVFSEQYVRTVRRDVARLTGVKLD